MKQRMWLQGAVGHAIVCLALGIGLPTAAAHADQTIECMSKDNRHNSCPIGDQKHGYVRVQQQLSDTTCVKGQNWDYDERAIWVDEGCHAQFVVEAREQKDHSGAVAAAAIIGAIAVGIAAARHNDDSHHKDDKYYGGGHSSYVPSWMTGEFSGYNPKHRKQVQLTIESDGRATVSSGGSRIRGYVNDRHLYVGDHEFSVDRIGDGIGTTEIGDRSNHVVYSREGGSRKSVGYAGDEYDTDAAPQIIMGRNGEGEVIFASNNCVVYYKPGGKRKNKSNACSSKQGHRADDAMKRYRREQGM